MIYKLFEPIFYLLTSRRRCTEHTFCNACRRRCLSGAELRPFSAQAVPPSRRSRQMRFGETLAAHRLAGWRYVDYDVLKQMIKAGCTPRAFYDKLLLEISAVNGFFLIQSSCKPAKQLTDLRRAAVLNYLAVLKISKKHAKIAKKLPNEGGGAKPAASELGLPQAVETELRASSFCVALRDPTFFEARYCDEEHDDSSASSSNETCAVCLESLASDNVRLGCQHAYCWTCLAGCAANGIKTCPLCRSEQSIAPVDIEIEALLGSSCSSPTKYSPGIVLSPPSEPPEPRKLRVLSWNLCAIAFPFTAPGWKLGLGVLLGCSWHDRFRDAPLLPLEESSIPRLAQQAEYIKASEADIIMLQEVPGVSTITALLRFLGDDFDARYAQRRPSAFAVAAWVATTLLVAAAQLAILEPLLRMLLRPSLLDLTCGVGGRLALLFTAFGVRWRHSIVTQFLLGSVAGQLLVLRRKSSPAVGTAAGDGFGVVDFLSFDDGKATPPASAPVASMPVAGEAVQPKAGVNTQGWLHAFFCVRPRGVLQVSVPVVDASGSRGQLRVLTTHLPHASENDNLMIDLGARTADLARDATVLLGGDFNPLPDEALSSQFAPLLTNGNVPTSGLETVAETRGGDGECATAELHALSKPSANDVGKEEADAEEGKAGPCQLNTWDLRQPLCRKGSETPHTMQLDFLFVNQPARPQEAAQAAMPGDAETLATPTPAPPTRVPKLSASAASPSILQLPRISDDGGEEEDSEDSGSRSDTPPSPAEVLRQIVSQMGHRQRAQPGAKRALIRAACRRGRAAALGAARRTVLAPLPELEEVGIFCMAEAKGAAAWRTAAATAANDAGSCQLDVVRTELFQPRGFFVPGAPLSDHYGLNTTFTVTVA